MIFKDPLLRLLPSSLPMEFERMTEAEQAWRGRTFLMVWSLGGSDSVSWAMALSTEPVHVAEMKEILAVADDESIRDAVKTRRDAERASQRLGLGDLR